MEKEILLRVLHAVVSKPYKVPGLPSAAAQATFLPFMPDSFLSVYRKLELLMQSPFTIFLVLAPQFGVTGEIIVEPQPVELIFVR